MKSSLFLISLIALAGCTTQQPAKDGTLTLKDALGKHEILAGVAVNVEEVAGRVPRPRTSSRPISAASWQRTA